MVQIMHRRPTVEALEPAVPAAEVDLKDTPLGYINRFDAAAEFAAAGNDGQNLLLNTYTGELLDAVSGSVIGIDPFNRAGNGLPIDVERLSDQQLEELYGILSEYDENYRNYEYAKELSASIVEEASRREQEGHKTGDQPHRADQIPAINQTEVPVIKPKRGLLDRLNDGVTRIEKRAKSKDAKKALNAFNKENSAIHRLGKSREEKEAIDTRRAELEQQAGSYKEWRQAQKGERRAVTKLVKDVIASKRRDDPAGTESATDVRTVRSAARSKVAEATRVLATIHARLQIRGLDEATKTRLLEEKTQQEAIRNEAHQVRKANSLRALGKSASKAAKVDYDTIFESELPSDMFPSEEAREIFRDLHHKRIKTLKLGMEASFKFGKGKKAYNKAYNEYLKAFQACEIAIAEHARAEAGGELSAERENALLTSMVVNEMHAMESWQFQLATEAQSSLRGRLAMLYMRQHSITKIVLGVSVGAAATIVTGGVAGFAGGAVAGSSLAAYKVARAEGTRRARGIANQKAYKITDENRQFYLEADTPTDAFLLMAQHQGEFVKKARNKKRLGVAIGLGSLVAGYFIGDMLNDKLDSSIASDKVSTVHSESPVRVLETVTLDDAARVAPSTGELVSRITLGQGLIENLTHAEVGLNAAQAAKAVAMMKAEGLLDGTHIAGVAERAGQIMVYSSGAGDGALHYTDPAVLRIIQQVKSS